MAKEEPEKKKSATLQAFFKPKPTQKKRAETPAVKRPIDESNDATAAKKPKPAPVATKEPTTTADGQWTGQVPYAAVAATFSRIEATTKKLRSRRARRSSWLICISTRGSSGLPRRRKLGCFLFEGSY